MEHMAKLKTRYVCQACGSEQHRWQGQCPDCAEWNTLAQESAAPTVFSAKHDLSSGGRAVELVGLDAVVALPDRMQTGIAEFDRAVGGGIVPGSAMLLGGDPGIGKSTLLLQVAAKLAMSGRQVVYVSGEEAADQVRLRAIRLGLGGAPVQLAAATSVRDILTTVSQGEPPALIVIDSIQTMHSDLIEGAPGTVSQVRASAQELVRFAKDKGTAVVLVGHVTKDGSIAGPRVLEHMVDTVLGFEGERSHQYRILRAAKNRFGGTDEIGVFAMEGGGLIEVPNPSALFLTQRGEPVSGTSVFPALEGTRPVLVEIQALVVRLASGATPRRVGGWMGQRPAGDGPGGTGGALRHQFRDLGSLSERRRRLSPQRPGGGSGGCRRAGVGALRAAGAAGSGGDGRNRTVRRGPPGRACRTSAERVQQAGLRSGVGAGGDRRSRRDFTRAVCQAEGTGRPDTGPLTGYW